MLLMEHYSKWVINKWVINKWVINKWVINKWVISFPSFLPGAGQGPPVGPPWQPLPP